jgi:magnesium transporter
MSDTESYNQGIPIPTHDDDLHDHRNQSHSLPGRGRPVQTLTFSQANSSAITDSGDESEGYGEHSSHHKPSYGKKSLQVPSGPRETASSSTRRKDSIRGPAGPVKQRSHSFSDQIKNFILRDNDVSPGPPSQGQQAPISKHQSLKKVKSQRSFSNEDQEGPLAKYRTNDSNHEKNVPPNKRDRRASRSSIDSEADSHASRSSQETEEDVCFPMSLEHIRIKGIDFDEIEEFIKAEREEEQVTKEQQQLIAEQTAMRVSARDAKTSSTGSAGIRRSSAALKYTPKNILRKSLSKVGNKNDINSIQEENDSVKSLNFPETVRTDSSFDYERKGKESSNSSVASEQVKFGATKISDSSSSTGGLPDRFSFFSSDSDETIHAPDFPSLIDPTQSVREVFRNGDGTWWLDCVCPTDSEMKMLAKAFGIHPLTAEDIRMQETREKVELFRNYYFVCFHTFEPDKESEDYLEPIYVYMVVFREGILSFHFSPVLHAANVRRRVRQLRDYVEVSADWICYALIDDITDGFAPVITGIEYEADAIEDSVFAAREQDFGRMLMRIGKSRRKVMTLMRLLSSKADVIKMFAKRCQDEANVGYIGGSAVGAVHSSANLSGLASDHNLNYPIGFGTGGTGGVSFGPGPEHLPPSHLPPGVWQQHGRVQPRADIALYLGDIQDHVVTMFQNLLAYEKIFSRSHANYLAQLQVESVSSNNSLTQMLSKVTLIGTILVPLNLITGMFGMNVHVPGQDVGGYGWFFSILSIMVLLVSLFLFIGIRWLNKINNAKLDNETPQSSRRSIRSYVIKERRGDGAKSVLTFPNKYE